MIMTVTTMITLLGDRAADGHELPLRHDQGGGQEGAFREREKELATTSTHEEL